MSQMQLFLYMTGTAFAVVVFLAVWAQKELGAFVEELKFVLRQRVIAHNRVNAKLAVMTSRFQQLESESHVLRSQLKNSQQEISQLQKQLDEVEKEADALEAQLKTANRDLAAQTQPLKTQVAQQFGDEDMDETTQTIEKLEIEISSIKNMLNNDIRAQIGEYLKEVDGLTQKLKTARAQINPSERLS